MKVHAEASTIASIVEPMIARITIDLDAAKKKSMELLKGETGVMTDAAIKKIELGIDKATSVRKGLAIIYRTVKPLGNAMVELNDNESAYLSFVE